jgi:hypothetical protein
MIATTDTVVPAIRPVEARIGSRTDTTTARMNTMQMLNQVNDITTGATVTNIAPKATTSPQSTTLLVMSMLMATIMQRILTEDSREKEGAVRREITIHVLKELIRQSRILLRLRFVEDHLTRIPFLNHI